LASCEVAKRIEKSSSADIHALFGDDDLLRP
jgi:hypothetical protein